MTTTVRYTFFVEVDAPAGPLAEERSIDVDFETDDEDHALELADRHLQASRPLPANAVPGTLIFATL